MSDETKTYYIYGLTDPRDGRIRYVGITTNPPDRLRYHYSNRTVSPNGPDSVYPEYGTNEFKKYHWMRDLHDSGLRPGILKLDETAGKKSALLLEGRWIQSLKGKGQILYNANENKSSIETGTTLGK